MQRIRTEMQLEIPRKEFMYFFQNNGEYDPHMLVGIVSLQSVPLT